MGGPGLRRSGSRQVGRRAPKEGAAGAASGAMGCTFPTWSLPQAWNAASRSSTRAQSPSTRPSRAWRSWADARSGWAHANSMRHSACASGSGPLPCRAGLPCHMPSFGACRTRWSSPCWCARAFNLSHWRHQALLLLVSSATSISLGTTSRSWHVWRRSRMIPARWRIFGLRSPPRIWSCGSWSATRCTPDRRPRASCR